MNFTRLEIRFLLNFTLAESNILVAGGKANIVNLNNVKHDRKLYEKKIAALVKKLLKADEEFYK